MSTLYLGCDPLALAARLAEAIAAETRREDFFRSVTVVVPNRFQRKWLRLWLARRLGVAFNIQFHELDDALWPLLRALDPRPSRHAAEPLDENTDRLSVLSVLLEERDAALAPLQRYIQLQQPLSRLSCRRAWHLAEQLCTLFAEYETHRPELIHAWLDGHSGLGGLSEFHRVMERAQRTLFRHVAGEPDGRRALLHRLGGHPVQTLPHYAQEVMDLPEPAPVERRAIHVFGFTQLSELHVRVLAWLGRHHDVRVYHLNVVASRLRGTLSPRNLQTLALALRDSTRADETGGDKGRSLLRAWGRAGAEALEIVAGLLHEEHFAAEVTPAFKDPRHRPLMIHEPKSSRDDTPTVKKAGPTVLSRLHDHLLARPRTGPARLAQDTSLQIIASPGIVREVETVCESILHNLQENPQLRQTDIAVLATDMARYRPVLQAVFERPPQRVQYNLVDFSAAGLSALGQALLGMLDLAMESFTRSRVFQVMLNPCFLARLGVERTQALAWLSWAETLGIYHGWDADEKHAQGYPRSPLYAWRLGLQRLRLGRYMEVVGEDSDDPAPRFGHVIPFADLLSTDREHLDAFCRAAEGLLPALARLRHLTTGGQRWASHLQRLIHDFLDVPVDRPEEEQVRAELLQTCARLADWDHLHERPGRGAGLTLPLVREYVQGRLEKLEGSRGEYLVGGVTLSGLLPMRPMPFQIVYILGLSEELFPGSNALSSFDLRGAQRQPGDVRPAEQRLYDFLDALLSARQKLYLLYNNREPQRDRDVQPAAPLQQLRGFLSQHVTKDEFREVLTPLHGTDERFYGDGLRPPYQDALVHYREIDRFIAFDAAQRQGRWELDLNQRAELDAAARLLRPDFSVPGSAAPTMLAARTVSLTELKRFLVLPAAESLRRHLHVGEDDEPEIKDHEPLITSEEIGNGLVRQALQQLVLQAGRGDVEAALAGWMDRFTQAYGEARLRSRVPDEAFGAIDQKALCEILAERIDGQGGLAQFLRDRAPPYSKFCGPLLLGESLQPLGARLRVPALRLRPGTNVPADESPEVRVVGAAPFVWLSDGHLEVLVLSNAKKVDAHQLHYAMLEPTLLWLALLANAEPGEKGISSRAWFAPRGFAVHAAGPEGVRRWSYSAGLIEPDEALQYLTDLVRDLLDPGQCDMLPFEVLTAQLELRKAYDVGGCMLTAEQYRHIFEEHVKDAREAFHPLRVPLAVDLVGAVVPEDARAKVQRRFQLLDRGPAQTRSRHAGDGNGKGPRGRKR